MSAWIAASFGALDVSGLDSFPGASVLVTPTIPGQPLALFGEGAEVWRRLVAEGPVPEGDLTAAEREIVHDMAALGIATTDVESAARVHVLSEPWLSSPLHELVYALVASVARDNDIECAFIKGPVLHAQGLREREHSGDVDVWVHPARLRDFVADMAPWGWREQPDVWAGTPVNHSVTLEPCQWGCQIDAHRRLPGLTLRDEAAFRVLMTRVVQIEFSSVQAKVPDVAANSVLLGVHALRPEIGQAVSSHAADTSMSALLVGGDRAADFAGSIGAVAVLAEVLSRAFPERDFHPEGVPFDWRWRARPTKVAAYLTALRMLPPRRRPLMLWRLFWPSREVVMQSERNRNGRAVGAVSARLHRMWRGLSVSALWGRAKRTRQGWTR